MTADETELRVLRADIEADLAAIIQLHRRLEAYDAGAVAQGNRSEESCIALAYFMHNLYCAYESVMQRIAELFGNHLSDQSGWHAELLRRMTLDVPKLRPRLWSDAAFEPLDELRRFRHLFRSAYRMRLDEERLALVHRRAMVLGRVAPGELAAFVVFVDGLLSTAAGPA